MWPWPQSRPWRPPWPQGRPCSPPPPPGSSTPPWWRSAPSSSAWPAPPRSSHLQQRKLNRRRSVLILCYVSNFDLFNLKIFILRYYFVVDSSSLALFISFLESWHCLGNIITADKKYLFRVFYRCCIFNLYTSFYQESLRRLTGWRAPPWRGSRPRSCRPCPGCRVPRRGPQCQTLPCIAWHAWHCHVLQRLTCTSPQVSGCAPREQNRTKAGKLAKFFLERKK